MRLSNLALFLKVIASEAHRAEGADLSTLVLFDLDDSGREFKPRFRLGDPIGDEALLLEIAATRQGAPLSIEDFDLIPAYHSPVVGMRTALICPIFYEGRRCWYAKSLWQAAECPRTERPGIRPDAWLTGLCRAC